jgi:pyridoxamine 5'-phosphate oxidase
VKDNLDMHRKSYEKGELSKESVNENPLQQFRTWFYETKDAGGVDEVNAMTLTTVDAEGFPRGRVVLLKKYDEYGFYFFTNYNSDKARSLDLNNKVSLSFFWPNMERQIIIKGTVKKTSDAESNNYWQSRPKGSQLGALVSNQSSIVKDRSELEDKLKKLEEEYEHKEVPRPKDWGGYLVSPLSIEFWQGRPNRLHDRIRYTLVDYDWIIERLQP